jgi:hypothetical protein
MDVDERKMLERTLKLAEENNRILKGIQRQARIASILRFLYVLVVIAFAVLMYYFLQPYLTQLMEIYTGYEEKATQIQNVVDNLRP